jgi:hypothetical protein
VVAIVKKSLKITDRSVLSGLTRRSMEIKKNKKSFAVEGFKLSLFQQA